MKIWVLNTDFKNFYTYMFVDRNREKRDDILRGINAGKKTNNIFDGEEIEVHDGEIKADFSHLWDLGTQVLNEKARNILSDILEKDVELVELKSGDEKFYLINSLCVLDALDYELSEIEYAPSGPAVRVTKYTFKPNVVENRDIFKIYLKDRIVVGDIFVSDKFKELVEENNLTGFKFTEVWEG